MVLGASCHRAASVAAVVVPVAPVDAGVRWPEDPFEPVPPGVQAALAERRARPERALELLEQAHGQAVDAGDARTAAIALHRRGDVLAEVSPFRAEGSYVRALALYELLGETRLEAVACNDLGLLARSQFDQPLPWFRRGVELRRLLGDRAGLRVALLNLGATLALGRTPDQAVPVLREAAALAHDLHHAEGEWKAHADLAAALLLQDLRAQVAASDGGLTIDVVDVSPAQPSWKEALTELALAYRLTRALGRDPRETACVALPNGLWALCDAVEAAETIDGGPPRTAPR